MTAQAVYVGDDTVLVKTALGTKMFVDSTDTVCSPHIILDGVWEAWVTEFIKTQLVPGDSFVDVGSHVGWFTLLACLQVGPRGKVTAFDANARLVRLLMRSISINGFRDRAIVVHGAVKDSIGAASFFVPHEFSGNGRVGSSLGARGIEDTVPGIVLENYFAASHVDFIKIDAEGSEPGVVAGAKALLARCPKARLLIEHHLGDEALFEQLASWGREKIYVLEHTGLLRRLAIAELAAVPDSEMIFVAGRP